MHPTHDPDFLGARRAAAPPSFGFRPTRETPWHASQARPGGARVSLASAVGLARRLRKERAGSREDVRMRRTTASTDEKRHAACRTRPQTGVIQRALEYAMGIHDHRRWRLRRVLVGHAQIWLWAGCRTLPPIGHTAPPIYVHPEFELAGLQASVILVCTQYNTGKQLFTTRPAVIDIYDTGRISGAIESPCWYRGVQSFHPYRCYQVYLV